MPAPLSDIYKLRSLRVTPIAWPVHTRGAPYTRNYRLDWVINNHTDC